MGSRVCVGDFSVMTSLSRSALRQYHDLGLLVPTHIDAHTGYRLYDTSQVDLARIVRRLRELGMSIPDLKALLSTDDIALRHGIIAAQLHRIQTDLQHTQDVVSALRGLLMPARDDADIVLRHEPSTRGLPRPCAGSAVPCKALASTQTVLLVRSWSASCLPSPTARRYS